MKIAIVTGASSGMGKEFVTAIDKEYELDEIWVIARREERLKALQSECRTVIRPVPLDLSDSRAFSEIESLLRAENPQVELLVNDAGYGLFGTFEELPMLQQLGIIDVNDKALTAMCYICLPYMRQGSKIVNMGSNSSWQPVPYLNVYAASKAYVLSFSRGLGKELEKDGRGIHIMCVCPGWIKTEFMDTAVVDDTVKYYDRWYTAKQVVDKAMKDLKKNKRVSILGLPVQLQVLTVKFAPVNFVMNTWCKQQKK